MNTRQFILFLLFITLISSNFLPPNNNTLNPSRKSQIKHKTLKKSHTATTQTQQQQSTTTTTNKAPENKESVKKKHSHPFLSTTFYIILLVSIVLGGYYLYRYFQGKKGIIDDYTMNQEAELNQQVLTKQQQQGLKNYKFQSSNKDLEVSIVKPDLEGKNDSESSSNQMSTNSCFVMDLQGGSCIFGQKIQDQMKVKAKDKEHKQNQNFVYYEIEVLEVIDPEAVISVGFQPSEQEQQQQSLPVLNDTQGNAAHNQQNNNFVCFDGQGVVEYIKVPKQKDTGSIKPAQKKTYDYKVSKLKQDNAFLKAEQEFYFQEKPKSLSLKEDKKKHCIHVSRNKAKKVQSVQSDNIEDSMVMGLPLFHRNNIYEFSFKIMTMKSPNSIKIGVCGSLKWDKKGNFKNFSGQRYLLQSEGNIENTGFIDEQEQEEKSYLQFKQGSVINCKVDFCKRTLSFTIPSGKKAADIYHTIQIPEKFKQIAPIVYIDDLYDEVAIENGSITPQNLGYGEIIGVGLGLTTGRVWLSMNGIFLNQPTQAEKAKMQSKKGGVEKQGFFSSIFSSKANKKSQEENKEVEEVDEEADKQLQKRIIQLNPKKLATLVPFIKSTGRVKVNVNIGGKPFSLYQKNSIDYGFL